MCNRSVACRFIGCFFKNDLEQPNKLGSLQAGQWPALHFLDYTPKTPAKQGLATVVRPNIPSLVRVAGGQFWLDSSNDAGPPHLHYTDAQLEEWILAADHTGHQVALNAISADATAQLARVLGLKI